jgi:hypothetical protein
VESIRYRHRIAASKFPASDDGHRSIAFEHLIVDNNVSTWIMVKCYHTSVCLPIVNTSQLTYFHFDVNSVKDRALEEAKNYVNDLMKNGYDSPFYSGFREKRALSAWLRQLKALAGTSSGPDPNSLEKYKPIGDGTNGLGKVHKIIYERGLVGVQAGNEPPIDDILNAIHAAVPALKTFKPSVGSLRIYVCAILEQEFPTFGDWVKSPSELMQVSNLRVTYDDASYLFRTRIWPSSLLRIPLRFSRLPIACVGQRTSRLRRWRNWASSFTNF